METPPAVSEIRVNGSPLNDPGRQVVVGCDAGPRITVGGRVARTSLTSEVHDLVRGGSVTLRPCGSPTLRLTGPTDLLAAPRGAFRVDSVALVRPNGVPPLVEPVDVGRDQHGSPRSVSVPDRRATSLLTLNQNLNDGWTAELSGRTLPVQRVDGWKQGWVLPAGPADTVRLAYTPTGPFSLVLQAGCLMVLLVLLAATPLRLHRRAPELPPLRVGEPGALDVVVGAAAGALLTGFVGLVMMAAAAIVARRRMFTGWPGAAAVALMLAGVGLVWSPIEDQSWKLAWTQLWSMAAVACVVASLVPHGALPAPEPDAPALAGEALDAPPGDDGPYDAGGRGEEVRTGAAAPTDESTAVSGR